MRARLVANGLKALGLERGDVCSVAAEVVKEWLFADLGIICAGGVTNGVYPTDSPTQVEYLINDSGTRFYFAEDEEQLDKVLEVRERTPTLEKVIIFDMEGLRKLDDPMCMSFDALLDLGRDYGAENPDVWEAGNRRRRARRPDDSHLYLWHDRSAQGRDDLAGQHDVHGADAARQLRDQRR